MVSSITSTILFLFPGVITMMFVRRIGRATAFRLSDFESTVYGTAMSIPIFVILWLLRYTLRPKTNTITAFTQYIKTSQGLLLYLAFSVIVAFIVGVVLGKYLQVLFSWIVNLLRYPEPKNSPHAVWETFVGKRDESMVRIYALCDKENSIIGTFNEWSDPDESENGIMLRRTD